MTRSFTGRARGLGLALIGLLASASVAAADAPVQVPLDWKAPGLAANHGPSDVVKLKIKQGVLYPRKYAKPVERLSPTPAIKAPTVAPKLTIDGSHSFFGTSDPCCYPTDVNLAVAPSRLVQSINTQVAFIDKSTNAIGATGELQNFGNPPNLTLVTDPQFNYDKTTGRVYFTWIGGFTDGTYSLFVGWSKTNNPVDAGDFWSYRINYGTTFPDFDHLGDTGGSLIIGTNNFNPDGSFAGGAILGIAKPPAGDGNIPALALSYAPGLKTGTGSFVNAPIPGNMIDGAAVGWVAAIDSVLPASKVWFFKVTDGAAGAAPTISATPKGIPVGSYNSPPNASQPNTTYKVDTLEGRLAQATYAKNAAGNFRFYTSHTIARNGVASVQWYAFDVAAGTVVDSGLISGGEHSFNSAISNNRSGGAGGDGIAITYNRSSSSTFPQIRVAAAASTSGPLSDALVKAGTVSQTNTLACGASPDANNPCRWGDYPDAEVDPSNGKIYITNQLAGTPQKTYIAAVTP